VVSAAMITTLPVTPPAFRSAQRAVLRVVVLTSLKLMLESTLLFIEVIEVAELPIHTFMSLSLTT
jgi:hypothetical protein